jgi:hypothetical protein
MIVVMRRNISLITIAVAAVVLDLAADIGKGADTTAVNEWMIDDQADWESNTESQSGFEFKEGMAVPSELSATIRTKIKSFSQKRSPRSLVVSQSPVWDNWQAVPKIAPENLHDAPILLTIGPGDYWIFGRYRDPNPEIAFKPQEAKLKGFDIPLQTTPWPKQFNAPGGLKKSLGGYHAWQSRDMLNWVHHGPVGDKRAQWMTTAEFVDGNAYLYYDFPNDADPHLYIDEDLTDGVPGRDMGLVFKDPSHGSDCGVIRGLDGKFHMISEDWSPINASKHAWDSPLASHAVSLDGLGNFTLQAPPVDQRTKPTGRIGTYRHPHWNKEDPANYPSNVAEYEIHEPAQNSYGDWAAIAIGGRYYLFGDFEPAGSKEMSVARFTSPDINKPFTYCGNIGLGHPDPDVCFAEGRFYLINQTKQDFVSPGPWVELVEARVGVDTDNDGQINRWTPWQEIQEKYDYIPGFSKQIAKKSAALDLSKLPAGFGFKIELKTTNTTENAAKPILDKLHLSFGEHL